MRWRIDPFSTGHVAARDASLATEPAEYHARADAALQSFLVKFWSQALG